MILCITATYHMSERCAADLRQPFYWIKDMKTVKTKFIIPILLILLPAAAGYTFFLQKRPISDLTEETPAEKEEVETHTQKKESETDNSIIDGYWVSEKTEEGKFLEFGIEYPEVINFDGSKGKIERLDNYRFQYRITFDTEGAIFYLSSFDDDSALVWYCDEKDEYNASLKLSRIATDTKEEDAAAGTEPETQVPSAGTSSNSNSKPSSVNQSPDNSSSAVSAESDRKGHYEERQVLVKEAYDEQVLVRKGECSSVCVKEAYDSQEMVYLEGAYYGPDREEYEVCNQCGARFQGGISDHIANSDTCGGWHNEWVDVSEPYWHNVEYRTVHHDAVYETRCEPDEYRTVHHDAVYETKMVWIED